MDNKYVTIALIAAICVSLGGTFITLNRLAEVERVTYITGAATTDTGQGLLDITSQMSLIVNSTEDEIDFGSCAPDVPNNNPYSLYSNVTEGTASDQNCSLGRPQPFPDYIEIINNGNQDLNLTVQSSKTSTTFIGGTGAYFGFMTTNATGARSDAGGDLNGGCNIKEGYGDGTTLDWTEFSAAATKYQACKNLSYTSGKYQVTRLYLMVTIPPVPGVSGAQTSDLTFTADSII